MVVTDPTLNVYINGAVQDSNLTFGSKRTFSGPSPVHRKSGQHFHNKIKLKLFKILNFRIQNLKQLQYVNKILKNKV